jgi:flagellar biosynthesis/type III secretory pathway chaperone
MLKFYQQNSDNINSGVGFMVVCSYLTEGQSRMTREPDRAMMIQTAGTTEGNQQHLAWQAGGALDECLLVASQLLSVLREETTALQTFDSDLLLRLITQKEALVRDLGGKLNALKSDPDPHRQALNPPGSADVSGIPPHDPADPGDPRKRLILREVLLEIERGNQINRIFIEGSLTYGQDLLDLFIPGTYAIGQEGQAERLTLNTKGLALDKEA